MKFPVRLTFTAAELADFSRRFISVIAWVLAILFTWLQFKDLRIGEIASGTSPEVIQRLVLIFYYFCWLFGSRNDVRAFEMVCTVVPNRWKITLTAFVAILVFLLITVILLWVRADEKKFAAALTLFWAYNIVAWQYANYLAKPIISASREKFRHERQNFRLAQVRIIEHYMMGNWQWKRFVVLGFGIALTDIVCFVPAARETLSVGVLYFISDLDSKISNQLLPQFCLLLFVAVSEAWMWRMRLRMSTAISVIEDLIPAYSLQPKRSRK